MYLNITQSSVKFKYVQVMDDNFLKLTKIVILCLLD